jgi:hypothetical protein
VGPSVFPNLPTLHKGTSTFSPPNAPGEWHYSSWDTLEKVSQSMELDLESRPGIEIVHKLPDIWARVTMLHLALSSVRHPLHGFACNAYTGLIAVLALWKRRHWRLRALAIDLSALSSNDRLVVGKLFANDAAIRDRRSVPSSAAALVDLPHRLSSSTKWSSVAVLLLDDIPIAVTSPLTLICPVFGFEPAAAIADIPWWNDGSPQDPTNFLNADARSWVKRWIAHVSDQLADESNQVNSAYSDHILRVLHEFDSRLSGGLAVGHLVRELPEVGNGLCDVISWTAPSVDRRSWTRELGINSLNKNKNTLLVLERSTPTQWRRHARDIDVLPGLTFDIVDRRWNELSAGSNDLGIPVPEDTAFILADQLFLDHLYMVKVEDSEQAFPGALRVNGSDKIRKAYAAEPILPIASVLTQYLMAADVAQACEFQIFGNNVRVLLRLPLLGGAVTVMRDYIPDDLRFVDSLPILEIWPPFSSESWKSYFTLWGNTTNEPALMVRPVFDVGSTTSSHLAQEARPRGDMIRAVYKSDAPPMGFMCRLGPSDAGLLAVSLPQPPSTAGESHWRIGVDFGTTNTTVFICPLDKEPKHLQLRGLGTFQVTGAAKVDRLDWTNRFFLPPSEEMPALPFLTMYRSRKVGSLPILDGNIYFVPKEDPNLLDSSITSDLKWSQSAVDREKTQALLGETLLLALAQAHLQGVTHVSIHTAYPSSFWPSLRATLETAWSSCIDSLGSVTNINISKHVQSITESEAVARHFLEVMKATTNAGAMVIDIGGGSTDLAYWQSNNLKWQASIHLAGKGLLSECLLRVERLNPNYQAELKEFWPQSAYSQVAKPNNMLDISDRRVYERQIEAILARSEGDVLDRLRLHSAKKSLQFIIRHLALGLGGMLWYAGSAQFWVNSTLGATVPPLNIYVAGNGSRLWHWLCHGRFDQRALNGFVEQMARAGAGTHNVTLHLSTAPKSEVASGLVVGGYITDDSNIDPNKHVYAAEEVLIDGQCTDVLSRGSIAKAATLSVSKLDNLDRMFDTFNSVASARAGWFWKPFAPSEILELKQRVLSDVQQQLSGWLSTTEEDLQLEPIFILGLKRLLARHLEFMS